MSAYTSQRWSVNGSSNFQSDIRGPHDAERREFRSEHGEYERRQNGLGESFPGRESPHTGSPMTSGESPVYNRSVCDSEEFGRQSPVPYPIGYPPPLPPEMPRRKFHDYNGPRSHRPFHQRRHLLQSYDHPPLRGGPWGPPPHRGRRPFERFDERVSFPRYKSPILRKPPHRGLDQSFDNFHDRGYYTNSYEASVAPGESTGPPPSDPRLYRSMVDNYNHTSRSNIEYERKISRGASLEGDLVSKEHSYCGRTPLGDVKKQAENEVYYLTDPTLPQTHLSVVPEKFKRMLLSTSEAIPVSSTFIKLDVVTTTPAEINTMGPKSQASTCSWPVGNNYPEERFIMDLDSDEEASHADTVSESMEIALSTVPRPPEASDMNSTNSGKPVLLTGLISMSNEDEHESNEQNSGGKTATRRSKRLAQVLDDSPTSESPGEDLQEGPQKQNESVDNDTANARGEGVLKNRRRKGKKRFLRSAGKKKWKNLSKESVDGKNGVSTELKLLFSGDFAPEILTTRSRGESLTLVRRQKMEEEIEQHERERLQTARLDVEKVQQNNVSLNDAMDEGSSEHSATVTSSSTLTASHEQGSSVQDLDSSSQDLESISLTCSDSVLEEFSPELILRCKRITSAKSSGDTPLHKVCRNGRFDMVQCLLLALKVNPNTPDNAGWTPLHEACSNNRVEIARFLLKSGADANASARDGTRPIHDAIEIGALEVVRLLVEHGADPTAELADKSPLDLAKTTKTMRIYEYLLPVVKEHQDRINSQKATTAAPAVRRSTRATVKHLKKVRDEDPPLVLPIDGYTEDDPLFGQELDYPLFHICPVLELSESPLLPVYNFEIVPGKNPRRHNFYLLSDLLEELCMTESELRRHCSEISALEMTVGELMSNLKHPHYNRHVSVPTAIKTLPKSKKVKFLPACSQLRSLLDIQTVNLDD